MSGYFDREKGQSSFFAPTCAAQDLMCTLIQMLALTTQYWKDGGKFREDVGFLTGAFIYLLGKEGTFLCKIIEYHAYKRINELREEIAAATHKEFIKEGKEPVFTEEEAKKAEVFCKKYFSGTGHFGKPDTPERAFQAIRLNASVVVPKKSKYNVFVKAIFDRVFLQEVRALLPDSLVSQSLSAHNVAGEAEKDQKTMNALASLLDVRSGKFGPQEEEVHLPESCPSLTHLLVSYMQIAFEAAVTTKENAYKIESLGKELGGHRSSDGYASGANSESTHDGFGTLNRQMMTLIPLVAMRAEEKKSILREFLRTSCVAAASQAYNQQDQAHVYRGRLRELQEKLCEFKGAGKNSALTFKLPESLGSSGGPDSSDVIALQAERTALQEKLQRSEQNLSDLQKRNEELDAKKDEAIKSLEGKNKQYRIELEAKESELIAAQNRENLSQETIKASQKTIEANGPIVKAGTALQIQLTENKTSGARPLVIAGGAVTGAGLVTASISLGLVSFSALSLPAQAVAALQVVWPIALAVFAIGILALAGYAAVSCYRHSLMKNLPSVSEPETCSNNTAVAGSKK